MQAYSEKDPALNSEESDFEAYVDDNLNEEHLKFLEGKHPVIFTFDEPSRRDRMRYWDRITSDVVSLYYDIFLNHVKGFKTEGPRKIIWDERKAIKQGRIDEKWLEKEVSDLTDGEIGSIGAVIMKSCVLNRDKRKN